MYNLQIDKIYDDIGDFKDWLEENNEEYKKYFDTTKKDVMKIQELN